MGKRPKVLDDFQRNKSRNPLQDFASPEYSKEEVRSSNEAHSGYLGGSDYDEGLLPGINQAKLRAENQPWYDQITNAAVKTVPGIALGIAENAGYLGELFSGDNDYNNALTELARKGREKLEETLPVYRENENQVFDLKDPAWWINHGQGLVESVGEFLVTGAGVGGGLNKTAKLLLQSSKGIKGAELLGEGLQKAAQLGTASLLSYTEGAMSGADVYKRVLAETGDKQKASEAAAQTVRLNTLINTGLNVTSLTPLFKTFNKLDDGVRQGLTRQAGETTKQYVARIKGLADLGVPEANHTLKFVGEAVQEGLEENVNLFAEQEGLRVGKGKGSTTIGEGISNFLRDNLSQEGALNSILGAVGGVAQTAGMEYLPLRTTTNPDGTTQRISAAKLEQKQAQEYQHATLKTFIDDVNDIHKNQEILQNALKTGNKLEAEKAKNDLFNVGLMRSLRNETAPYLAKEVEGIAQIDNTQLGKDGKTDAMRMGLADNTDDNAYKETATKRAGDIIRLNKEYRDLIASTSDPITASAIFRKRLDVYSYESVLSDLTKDIHKKETELTQLATDDRQNEVGKLYAEHEAHKIAIAHFKEAGNEKAVTKLENSKKIVQQVLKDTNALHNNPDINEIEGLTTPLTGLYAAKLILGEDQNATKMNYAEALRNPVRIKQEFEKGIEDNKKIIQEAVDEKAEKEKEEKRVADLAEAETKAKEEKAQREYEAGVKSLAQNITQAKDEKSLSLLLRQAGDNLESYLQHPAVKDALAKKQQELTAPPPIIEQQITGQSESQEKEEEKPEIDLEQYGEAEQHSTGLQQLEVANVAQVEPVNDTTLDTTTEEVIQNTNNPDNTTYANYNKIAYKAQEQNGEGGTADPYTINPAYQVLHSRSFGVGTKVVLKVAKETKFYEANKNDVNKIPIGIYYQGKLVGYIPVYKFGMNPILSMVRNVVMQKGEVEDYVKYKGAGELNKGPKRTVKENYSIVPEFVVGRDGTFESSYENPYKEKLLNKTPEQGVIYTVNIAPNGDRIATPADVNKVSDEFVTSFMNALNLYFKKGHGDRKSSLTKEEEELILTLQERFNLDLTKTSDLKTYFASIFYETNMNQKTDDGKAGIKKIKAATSDRAYVQLVPGGIKFMRGGDEAPTFYGHNDLEKTEKLKQALSSTFARVDLTKLNNKEKFSLPLIKEGGTIGEYKTKNYNEHVANITSTNIVAVKIGKTIQTALVQPNIYLAYSFMNDNTTEKITAIQLDENKKVVSLEEPKKSKGFKSLVAINKSQLTKKPDAIVKDDLTVANPELLERYKDRCR